MGSTRPLEWRKNNLSRNIGKDRSGSHDRRTDRLGNIGKNGSSFHDRRTDRVSNQGTNRSGFHYQPANPPSSPGTGRLSPQDWTAKQVSNLGTGRSDIQHQLPNPPSSQGTGRYNKRNRNQDVAPAGSIDRNHNWDKNRNNNQGTVGYKNQNNNLDTGRLDYKGRSQENRNNIQDHRPVRLSGKEPDSFAASSFSAINKFLFVAFLLFALMILLKVKGM